jgi:hypothetical protein
MKFQCLWPFDAIDPRNKPEPPHYEHGRFPLGDRIVIDMIQKNVPRETIFREYMEMNIADHVDLDALLDADLKRMREVDSKCDIKVYHMIAEEFRIKKLFYLFYHPIPSCIKRILLEILDRCGLTDLNPRGKYHTEQMHTQSIIDGIENYFGSKTIYDNIQKPIHPAVPSANILV